MSDTLGPAAGAEGNQPGRNFASVVGFGKKWAPLGIRRGRLKTRRRQSVPFALEKGGKSRQRLRHGGGRDTIKVSDTVRSAAPREG